MFRLICLLNQNWCFLSLGKLNYIQKKLQNCPSYNFLSKNVQMRIVHFSLQWFLSFYICWHFPLKSPKNISSRATCLCLEKWARKWGLNGKFNISLLSGNSLTVYNLRVELQMTCLWNEISTHQITENDKLMTSQF